MDYIRRTMDCAKRNNGYILLFLAFSIFAWFEVLVLEKYVTIPSLYNGPILDESMIDEIIVYLQSKRYITYFVSIIATIAKVLTLSFVLYIGHFYINSVNKQKFSLCFKAIFCSELLTLLYRLYLVIIRVVGLDITSWDIKYRFSLLKLLDIPNTGLLAELFGTPLATINIVNVLYCIILVFIVSRFFKIRFLNATKYVLYTVVLITMVSVSLTSFLFFING